jgi:PadR family transcriptional regulator, regulatory protein PadR
MAADLLGSFEHAVMLAVLHLGNDQAYGMKVRKVLAAELKKDIAIGAVYSTLERLELKGFVSSSGAAGGDDRGGNPRRCFRVEGAGMRAVRQTEAAFARLKALQPAGGVA